MANLTITIDDETLRRAEMRATQQGTSVDALLARYLAEFAGPNTPQGPLQQFLDDTQDWKGGSGPGGRTWKRDDLYEP